MISSGFSLSGRISDPSGMASLPVRDPVGTLRFDRLARILPEERRVSGETPDSRLSTDR